MSSIAVFDRNNPIYQLSDESISYLPDKIQYLTEVLKKEVDLYQDLKDHPIKSRLKNLLAVSLMISIVAVAALGIYLSIYFGQMHYAYAVPISFVAMSILSGAGAGINHLWAGPGRLGQMYAACFFAFMIAGFVTPIYHSFENNVKRSMQSDFDLLVEKSKTQGYSVTEGVKEKLDKVKKASEQLSALDSYLQQLPPPKK